MIEVKSVEHFYGKTHALKGINFQVPSQCVAGFIGPNGSGKSTALKLLAGILQSHRGDIKLDGMSLKDHPIEARKKIGYMPETPLLHKEMQVNEYLVFVCKLKGLPKSDHGKSCDYVIERCGLTTLRTKLIGWLSKGNRQRVAMAQALLGNPSIILLDEPLSAVDPEQAIELRELIAQLGKQASVLMSSHVLPDISQICNHVVFIKEGIIQYQGLTHKVGVDSGVKYPYILLKFELLKDEWLEWFDQLPGLHIKEKLASGNELKISIQNEEANFFSALFELIVQKKLPLREVISKNQSLEVLFKKGQL